MYSPSLRASGSICWRCQSRILDQRHSVRRIQTRNALSSAKALHPPQRAIHITRSRNQLGTVPTSSPPAFNPALIPRPSELPLRHHLVQWQQQYGGPTEEVLSAFENHPAHENAEGDVHNGMSKLNSGFKADEDVNEKEWDPSEEHDGEELITIGLFLKPGDVVELTQPGREPVLAVFVQQFDTKSQFFSVNGRWCHSILGRIAFAITGCINPSMLQPLTPYLPTDPTKAVPKGEVQVPTNIAAPVQSILQKMTEEAEKIYRTNAPVLDTAYAVLADPHRTRMMTLAQIAKTLLGQNDPAWKSSPAALLAVRKSLNHNEFRFRSDVRSHRLTNVFAIRPKNDVQVVETVHEWIREHREWLASCANQSNTIPQKRSKGATYIEDFLEKSRRLIAVSRKDRDPSDGSVGPSKSRQALKSQSNGFSFQWGEAFTSTDKQVINFLQAWVLTRQFEGNGGLHSACASLVAATGCYGVGTVQNTGLSDAVASEVRCHTGLLFLQEIGVVTPFENRTLYDEQLMLPTVRLSRNLELLNTKAEQTKKNPDFRDSMAHLRRDWGTTTVYCIDDAGAQEIDDGISIEQVKGSTTEFWVHVHVANPTAFFDKTHTLSGLAAHMTETVYTPERNFPMLPSWATQGYFSMDRDRPVLTFSSRIDADGNALETKIQPGIVRKIISITPADVSSLLGGSTSQTAQETRRLVVGGDIPVIGQSSKPPNLSAEELKDLQDLYSAAKALWSARRRAGGVRIGNFGHSVRVFQNTDQPRIAWHPPSTDRSRLVRGDPIIELTQRVPKGLISFGVSSDNIVEEMMLLACSTAASWCNERGIPVMYRGTVSPPQSETIPSAELRDRFVMPLIEKGSEVPHGLASRYLKTLGRAIAHSSPLSHNIIGVPGYVKVTSPLRRFSDMIAHWQIEAAIRHEAKIGKKASGLGLVAPGSRGILPFTQRQMQESIVTLSPRERIISSTKRMSVRHWSMLALHRAFYYKEADLPEVFRFWARDTGTGIGRTANLVQGVLPEYGFPALMIDLSDAQAGDEWEVRLERIDMFSRHLYVKPIRLLQREDPLV